MLSHILSNTTCSWLDFTCFLCYVNHMLLGSTLESTTQKCAILAVTPWPIISGSSWITMNCMCNEIQTTGVLKNCQILGWSWVILWKNNQNPQDRLRWWVHTLHLPKTHPTSISYKLPLCNKGNLRGGGGMFGVFSTKTVIWNEFPQYCGVALKPIDQFWRLEDTHLNIFCFENKHGNPENKKKSLNEKNWAIWATGLSNPVWLNMV